MYLQLLVIMAFFGISSACVCPNITEDEKFCTGNFAASIYVKGGCQDLFKPERIYDIEIIKKLRGPSNIRRAHHLKTATHSCGATLQPNKYYVISGHLAGGRLLESDFCKLKIEYDNKMEADKYEVPTCR
ncbi:uncharacterized protein LOC127851197 [Dreissena polymorpha]|uniref:NTR domain-containing protein n=1 Tax=Dreissena polymorpha TaxID=45954 RepID=A0A9D4NAN0_DREPO|nr:uncharacterized protein LOC127851197 [Dreissena polymorpha]KAH3890224.1 hypothetical protein DPMN_014297 [Dreissena polymorpha]